jgi:hypothetical protein
MYKINLKYIYIYSLRVSFPTPPPKNLSATLYPKVYNFLIHWRILITGGHLEFKKHANQILYKLGVPARKYSVNRG